MSDECASCSRHIALAFGEPIKLLGACASDELSDHVAVDDEAPVRRPSNVADEVLDVDDPVLEQVARAVGMRLARQLGAPPVTIRLPRFMGQRAARVVGFEPDIHQHKPKEET